MLYEDAICAVAGSHHPLTQCQNLRLAELTHYPWIFPLRDSPARATLEQHLHKQGLELPTNLTESLSLITNIGLLQGSDTIMFIPLTAARHFAGLGLLTILKTPALGSFGRVGYSVKADHSLPPATQLFIGCLA